MISICILNWNCLNTLKDAVTLICNDLIDIEHEIIIYDQNSSDGSVDYIKSITATNIISILDNQNSGNSIARNLMINKAKYKYILLLDSDIIPIKNSIKAMIKFMEENNRYVFIGYNWKSYTKIRANATTYETGIEQKDIIDWPHKIALSQYGIFKSSVLKEIQFPEFHPFNGPGWGAEDDILGHCIYNQNIGPGGSIMNRVYYHDKSSSISSLGQDTHQRTYIDRLLSLYYFKDILNANQQLEAIKNQKLPNTKLKCNKYSWDIQKNLGDVATNYVLETHFPFFHFDIEEKNNLLMFGGTVLNHIENANKKYNANFKNVLYFGVGVSKQAEFDHAWSMIKKNNVEYTIIPRGHKSLEELTKNLFKCYNPIGDVLQLFSAMPKIINNQDNPELLVYDIWHQNLIQPNSDNFLTIRVADNKSLQNIPFYDLKQFLEVIGYTSKIYSSQVHPILIGALLGKPCSLYQKDWRASDFSYFRSFKKDMTEEEACVFRSEVQKNIHAFSKSFFHHIKVFL